jgi:hypothetical protein
MSRVEINRDKSGLALNQVNRETTIELKILFSKVPDWKVISHFENLTDLEIADYNYSSFEPISKLGRLRRLRLLHFPKLTSIKGIESNIDLEEVSLESLPSWDASSKYLQINSIREIGSLKRLRLMRMFGVKTRDGKLSYLKNCKGLEKIEIGRGYIKNEYNELRLAFPNATLSFPNGITFGKFDPKQL